MDLAAEHPVVPTPAGRLRGTSRAGVRIVRGIPYAAPPVGARRFAPPAPVTPWTGIRDALAWGPVAMQEKRHRLPAFAWYYPELGPDLRQSEDCLTLAVFTPGLDDARRPVMVWIHGGGQAAGSPAAPGFDPTALVAETGVVVVSVAHRLNVFGYFHPGAEAGETFADSANAGILDLVAALEWVRDAIATFGGDPACVTIFGESGGGGKVGKLMAMPAARGLFHRAIIQSAAHRQGSPADATEDAHRLLRKLDLTPTTAERIRGVPAEALLAARLAVIAETGLDRFQPVADGRSLHEAPFHREAPAASAEIPLLVGTCAHESVYQLYGQPGILELTRKAAMERLARLSRISGEAGAALWDTYAALRPEATPYEIYRDILTDQRYRLNTLGVAEARARQGVAPTWLYRFEWRSPFAGLGTPHTSELPFIFGTLDATRAMMGDGPELAPMQRIMMQTWAAFARSGNPANRTLPEWAPYDEAGRATMLLAPEPRAVSDPPGADIEALKAFRITGIHSTTM